MTPNRFRRAIVAIALLTVLLIVLMSLSGCNGVIVNVFNPTTGKLQERIIVTSTMVTQDINSLTVETCYAKVRIDKLSQIYNSESWVNIGRGWAIATTGGLPELAEKWLVGNNVVDVNNN